MIIGKLRVYKTRNPLLGYAKIQPGLWMFVTTDGNKQTGPQYASKAELLADLERFANIQGYVD